jgi:hypothetical protein
MYRVRKTPPLIGILSQMNTRYIHTPCFSKIHFNINSIQAKVPQVVSYIPSLQLKLYPLLYSPMRSTFPIHLILLDLVNLINSNITVPYDEYIAINTIYVIDLKKSLEENGFCSERFLWDLSNIFVPCVE